MIQKWRFKRDDNGTEYTRSCDIELLIPRKIGVGEIQVGDKFKCISKLDGSEYTETLVGVGKKGNTHATGVFVMRSDALGINPDQRVEAMKADAELGCSIEYDEIGRAVFRSKKQYRRYAEAHGFMDRNGGYESPRSLNDNERQNLGLPLMAHDQDGGFLEYD